MPLQAKRCAARDRGACPIGPAPTTCRSTLRRRTGAGGISENIDRLSVTARVQFRVSGREIEHLGQGGRRRSNAVGALGDGGSRDRRGSAEGTASTRLGYVR
jgi:hypothetical protein